MVQASVTTTAIIITISTVVVVVRNGDSVMTVAGIKLESFMVIITMSVVSVS